MKNRLMVLALLLVFSTGFYAQQIPTGEWYAVRSAVYNADSKTNGFWKLVKSEEGTFKIVSAEIEFPATDPFLFKFEKTETGKNYNIFAKKGEENFALLYDTEGKILTVAEDTPGLFTINHTGEGMWRIMPDTSVVKGSQVLTYEGRKVESGTEVTAGGQQYRPADWWKLINPETGRQFYPEMGNIFGD